MISKDKFFQYVEPLNRTWKAIDRLQDSGIAFEDDCDILSYFDAAATMFADLFEIPENSDMEENFYQAFWDLACGNAVFGVEHDKSVKLFSWDDFYDYFVKR